MTFIFFKLKLVYKVFSKNVSVIVLFFNGNYFFLVFPQFLQIFHLKILFYLFYFLLLKKVDMSMIELLYLNN